MSKTASGKPAVTPARLFSEPPLNAAIPQKPLYVPAAGTTQPACVLFLMPRADAVQVLDLWRSDVAATIADTKPGALWLRSEDLLDLTGGASATESEAERAERERLRQFASGITQFLLRPGHRQLLVVVSGQGILIDLDSGATQRLTQSEQRHSGFTLSPKGQYLSYVRDGDLYALHIDQLQEQPVTQDASATVTSGLPDFIAQEEMHRFSGHWWHPEETHIALQRTDDSPVPVTYRHDIKADAIDVIEQRYPYAGGPNAEVQLGVYALATQTSHWLTFKHQPEDYLARVDWLDHDLWVQVQSRDQQTLKLLRFSDGQAPAVQQHEETSATWINLHDNLIGLQNNQLCWTSEQDGLPRLYVASTNIAPLTLQPLTPDDMHVTEVLGYAGSKIWFTGWRDTPTQLHLFSCAQASDPSDTWLSPQQVTVDAGWHQCQIASDANVIIDLHSSLEQPHQLSLIATNQSGRADIAGGSIDVDHPYHPFLTAHCTPTLGTLAAEDGTTLHFRLTRPVSASAANPAPTIVYVYGGPGGSRVRNEWAPLLLQMLAGAGYAVFELDNRGTGNRGRGFDAPIYQAMGSAEVRDQLQGVDWLRTQDWIDSQRIGVFGHSYGGFMTLKCLLAGPEAFAAGVSVAPVADWRLYDTHYTERYLGHPQTSPHAYQSSGLLGQCGKLQKPLLLIHGMADDNVLFANTTALLAELQQQTVDFELMTYPGSKHALQEPWVSIHRFNLLLKFFERTLKG